jgi:hypothetical protein
VGPVRRAAALVFHEPNALVTGTVCFFNVLIVSHLSCRRTSLHCMISLGVIQLMPTIVRAFCAEARSHERGTKIRYRCWYTCKLRLKRLTLSSDRVDGEKEYHGLVLPEQYQMSGGAFVAEMKSQTTREPLPWQDRNQLSATANAAVAAQPLYLQRPHCGRAKAEF